MEHLLTGALPNTCANCQHHALWICRARRVGQPIPKRNPDNPAHRHTILGTMCLWRLGCCTLSPHTLPAYSVDTCKHSLRLVWSQPVATA